MKTSKKIIFFYFLNKNSQINEKNSFLTDVTDNSNFKLLRIYFRTGNLEYALICMKFNITYFLYE